MYINLNNKFEILKDHVETNLTHTNYTKIKNTWRELDTRTSNINDTLRSVNDYAKNEIKKRQRLWYNCHSKTVSSKTKKKPQNNTPDAKSYASDLLELILNNIEHYKISNLERLLIASVIDLSKKIKLMASVSQKRKNEDRVDSGSDTSEEDQTRQLRHQNNLTTYREARTYNSKKTKSDNKDISERTSTQLNDKIEKIKNKNQNTQNKFKKSTKNTFDNSILDKNNTRMDVTTENNESIITYIFTGAKLSTVYNDNKRIEFTSIERAITTQYNNAIIDHASILKHDNEYRLKIRTGDKNTQIKLEEQKMHKQLLGGITMADKHITTSTKPVIMNVIRVPDEYNERDIEELKYLYEKHSIKNIRRKLFENNKKSSTLSIEVENEEKAYSLMANSLVLHGTKCRVIPQIRHPELCVECLSYGHHFLDCPNEPTKNCHRCGQEHHYKDCTSENLTCYHCKRSDDLSIDIKHSAVDHENCTIYMQEYQLANQRMFDLVNKYNEKFEIEIKVPIFKNNRLFINKANMSKKPKWDERIESRLNVLEKKCSENENNIITLDNQHHHSRLTKNEELIESIKADYEIFKPRTKKIDQMFEWMQNANKNNTK